MFEAFLRGKHVCRDHSGFLNAVFLNQFGEQMYIRDGKSLSQEQVRDWVLSHHVCNMMSMKMDNMFSEEAEDEFKQRGGSQKEEGRNRKKLDAIDRPKI